MICTCRLTVCCQLSLPDTTGKWHHCSLAPLISNGLHCIMSAFCCVEENDQAELWAQLSAGPSAVRSENYIVSKRPITVQTLEGYQSGDISLGKKNKETLCPKKY